MKNRRRLILVPLAAVAVALAFASVAFACTKVVGSITTTHNGNTCSNSPPSCSVQPGDTVTSTGNNLNVRVDGGTGSGAPDGTRWGLYFLNYRELQDSMDTCMSGAEQKIGGSQTQASNSVTISGQIPLTAQPTGPTESTLGPALVCLLSENTLGVQNYAYATPSTELNVV